jgi:hypothetical protein
MWKQFTERARQAVNDATQAVIRLGDEFTRTDQILLAFCAQSDCTATVTLQ